MSKVGEIISSSVIGHLQNDPMDLLNIYNGHRKPDGFSPGRIILSKGILRTEARSSFTRRICGVFPDAEIIEQLDTAHSKVNIPGANFYEKHHRGKRTLVIGELLSAVRYSEEEGNTCPNYWHFSPYGFCPYGCHYCYLAGTVGVRFSPSVKIYVNLPEMLEKVSRVANSLKAPVLFYVGKLQDALALDPLTGYSRMMIPFFAEHPYARLVMLTKSADVRNLLDLEHKGKTILSWTLNAPSVVESFEVDTPSIEDRIEAMIQCRGAGYPVRAVIMPLIPVDNWRAVYGRFLENLLSRVKLDRLTLGGICSYRGAYELTCRKLTTRNAISENLEGAKSKDGRLRYPLELRLDMYRHLINLATRLQPGTELALCLEEKEAWEATGLTENLGRCNCTF